MSSIQLIVGLGNPGAEYNGTRHNAGEQFVRTLSTLKNVTLNNEKKYHGLTGKFTHAGRDVRVLIPTTYMNLSGKSVSALASFYHITPDEILVAHDELDMPPGVARLKQGGGHGGHNGLRDIIPALGNRADFARLRIGIGHPGQARDVSDYVLGRAPAAERELIEAAINNALAVLPQILDGDFANAMNVLHAER